MQTSRTDWPCLFVYGSLRRNYRHTMHDILEEYARYQGEGIFQGKLYDLGSYPGAILSSDSSDRIVGEIYQLRQADKVLRLLDRYEGCHPQSPDPEYVRQQSLVTLYDGKSLLAWIYLYCRAIHNQVLIPHGDYLRYLERAIPSSRLGTESLPDPLRQVGENF